ncbi:anti-sigma F factor antagonist [Paenibacillus crassostreae]|uniref:Anti-sigma F factor antagonist n=1 Tax=Paenibacillus crassostreae TaxID=1763538 RepID=A0A167DII5_9BACL|nr:anti-sigma F factor antagonist [Paenibacillus crassostreae]AOZ91426.1 anti-sigma F factor antagonist [Paenibacillus crassostreae]OAB74415.1 anti-sigma F factor antagonist [Paenibacillus crassostreae]
MNLQMSMEHQRQVLFVRFSGELDHHTADHVRMKLDEAINMKQTEHIVLSLKDLQFMDSSGIGVILGRYKLIKSKGGKMAVCDVNPPVYRLFEMSGLFKIIPIYKNEDEALSGLEVVS